MWSYAQIDDYLRKNLKESRYVHTLGVVQSACSLAKINGVDEEKTKIAALIHDAAKNMKIDEQYKILKENNIDMDIISENSPQILHGWVAAILAKELMGVTDEEIINAVKYHTTARKSMSKLEKIIYIADYIEPNRDYPGVEELREITFSDLDKGVLMGIDNTITFVIKQGQLVHPLTIEARNYLILEMRNRDSIR
jgi:predicted HD superfamily hydrolase involved in NAD metabolism